MPLPTVHSWHAVDASLFRSEILPRGEPAILRGLLKDWPVVQMARRAPEEVAHYLAGLDNGTPVDAIMTPPEARGRIFYNDDLSGFNYLRNRLPLAKAIEQVARYSAFETAPAVAVQSAPVDDCLPGFRAAHAMPLLGPEVAPRIWIGGKVVTPAHFDQAHNLAAVACGKRRFTLFPSDQVDNLYIGPLDFAPTPTPISMVDFRTPDFQRFPRFKQALENARVAELEPGDVLYMPGLWWHHVESLEVFNVLVNYWWGAGDFSGAQLPPAIRALLAQPGSRTS